MQVRVLKVDTDRPTPGHADQRYAMSLTVFHNGYFEFDEVSVSEMSEGDWIISSYRGFKVNGRVTDGKVADGRVVLADAYLREIGVANFMILCEMVEHNTKQQQHGATAS